MKFLTSYRSSLIFGIALCLLGGGLLCNQLRNDSSAEVERLKARRVDVRMRTVADSVLKEEARKVAVREKEKSLSLREKRKPIRRRVELRGDTVLSDGVATIMPSVVALIKHDDVEVHQDSTTIARMDTLQVKSDTLDSSRSAETAVADSTTKAVEKTKGRCNAKCGGAIVGALVILGAILSR